MNESAQSMQGSDSILPGVCKKRKRNRVPLESRKRATRACESCRRVKEKCQGGCPCSRCARLKRQCNFDNDPLPSTAEPCGISKGDLLEDASRIRMLQDIVRHYTHIEDFDSAHLSKILSHIQTQSDGSSTDVFNRPIDVQPQTPISTNHRDDPRDLSHSGFAEHVQKNLAKDIPATEPRHSSRIESRSSMLPPPSYQPQLIQEAIQAFPPSDVATFLVDIFFEIAQTNYFYVDKGLLQEKLALFSHGSFLSQQSDASWVCISLMVFAIGTQFAHLSIGLDKNGISSHDNALAGTRTMQDHVALQFYASARALLPDIIAVADVASVQALLLLGIYMLPVDAGGISWLYLGISMKLAIFNDLHRTSNSRHSGVELELRNRIWWTVYTLERRISVLHGRPMSITRREVDTELPVVDAMSYRPSRNDTTANILAMIWLTCFLEDGRERLLSYKQSSGDLRAASMESIMSLRNKTIIYWESLPQATYCRDLNPQKPLFRFNVHLALTYHLVHVFIGRFFILKILRGRSGSLHGPVRDRPHDLDGITSNEQILAEGSLKHSLEIINLCQKLNDEIGLSASSYTEYTSCCAALLVILAQRTRESNRKLQQSSSTGIQLLKSMAVGLYDDKSDKLAIEALEATIRQLDHSAASSEYDISSGYGRFRQWASSAGHQTTESERSRINRVSTERTADCVQTELPEYETISNAQDWADLASATKHSTGVELFDFDAFLADSSDDISSIPGMDQWFRYGFR